MYGRRWLKLYYVIRCTKLLGQPWMHVANRRAHKSPHFEKHANAHRDPKGTEDY